MKINEACDLLTQLKTIIAADNSWSQEAKDIMGEALDTAIQVLKQNDNLKNF